jgi:hypothetical protein
MKDSITLMIDGIVNFLLGSFLLFFPRQLVQALGLPSAVISFYPSILGAVLVGIAIALLIENFGKQKSVTGLGLGGAIAINLCGGAVLALWLIFGRIDIPTRGYILLWSLVFILFVLSSVELGLSFSRSRQEKN